jgi:3-phytase
MVWAAGCKESRLPIIPPEVISEKTQYDTDDPAIWINAENTGQSIVFGTDKATDGAIYAFDLQGRVLEDMTIRNIRRPNNVDVEYGLKLNDSVFTDILVFTERERQQVRVFSVPEMKPLDGGGLSVFEDEANQAMRLPMGVALFKSAKDSTIYVVVGRKTGPSDTYLYQYALRPEGDSVEMDLVRKFGKFSGAREIEAIAVDDALGFVYYADEGVCIRKYNAEPAAGNEELACFGGEHFREDIEGIALASYPDGRGYLLVSNQQQGEFNIFDRNTNAFVKAVNLGTTETDGCDAVTVPLGSSFPNGIFVAMSDDRTFRFYDLSKILR